jgi:hypothetical protein
MTGIFMTSSSRIRSGLIAAVCLLSPLLSVAQQWGGDKHDHLLSFQVPSSTATYPLSINEARTVTGYYISNSGVTGGFVRSEDGQISTFNVPGSILTEPVSINAAGDIAGFYEVSSGTPGAPVPEGFIRSANGTITTFGSTALPAQPVAINAAGEVVGNYPNITFSGVVFIQSPTGSLTDFTLSDGASYSTFVTGLNDGGEIVGYTSSESVGQSQGFLINSQGPLPSPVDNTGVTAISVSGSTGTFPTAINADETVVGCYFANNVYQDFVYQNGVIETLNIPGTIPSCLPGFSGLGIFNVNPTSITVNDRGTITGYYTNTAKASVGFVLFADGKLITFDHPGSTQTIPTSINNRDVIAGYYSRGSEIVGFIRER